MFFISCPILINSVRELCIKHNHENLLARTKKCGLKNFQCHAVANAFIEKHLSYKHRLFIKIKPQRRRAILITYLHACERIRNAFQKTLPRNQ